VDLLALASGLKMIERGCGFGFGLCCSITYSELTSSRSAFSRII